MCSRSLAGQTPPATTKPKSGWISLVSRAKTQSTTKGKNSHKKQRRQPHRSDVPNACPTAQVHGQWSQRNPETDKCIEKPRPETGRAKASGATMAGTLFRHTVLNLVRSTKGPAGTDGSDATDHHYHYCCNAWGDNLGGDLKAT